MRFRLLHFAEAGEMFGHVVMGVRAVWTESQRFRVLQQRLIRFAVFFQGIAKIVMRDPRRWIFSDGITPKCFGADEDHGPLPCQNRKKKDGSEWQCEKNRTNECFVRLAN